jgi:hypothetical protein
MTDFLHFAYRARQLHKPASVQTKGISASGGGVAHRRGDGIATAASQSARGGFPGMSRWMWNLVFRGHRADGDVAPVADIRCWCARHPDGIASGQ